MRRYLLHLSYFGTRYSGFQKQNICKEKPFCEDPHTICGLLEIGLKGCKPTNHPVVISSSRTDKGVHGLCNTIHVDLEGDRLLVNSASIVKQVNRFFTFNDHDIRVLKAQQVADDFHCRHNALERRYMYRIAVPRQSVSQSSENPLTGFPITELNRCFFLQNQGFDSEAVKSACNVFVGEKDFTAVSSVDRQRYKYNTPTKSKIRNIFSFELLPGTPFFPCEGVAENYEFWHFAVTGKSFLYHQVRRMVSALIRYGEGKVSLADIQRLIDEPVKESWNVIGSVIPPHGLFLLNVLYRPEDLAFSEKQAYEELIAKTMEEEKEQIIQRLKTFDGTVSEKINLKFRLLEIEKLKEIR